MMRLMLGTEGNPSLLVSVADNYDPTNFKFDVVNGAWEGHFTNGHISVLDGYGYSPPPFSSLDTMEILTDNQDRLRGEYQEVFNNFDNPNYVAPAYKYVPDDFDDDIPF